MDLFFDIGTLAARAHIDTGCARMAAWLLAAVQYPVGAFLHTMMAARLLGFFASLQWPSVDVGWLW